MSPYIKRDYTIRMMRITAQRQEDSVCEPEIKAFCRKIWDRAISVVRHESGHDVVPVVRCKNCRHGRAFFDASMPGGPYVLCGTPYAAPRETHKFDYFCADGEKKEENA